MHICHQWSKMLITSQSQKDSNVGCWWLAMAHVQVAVKENVALRIRREMLQSQSWDKPGTITVRIMEAGGHQHGGNRWDRGEQRRMDHEMWRETKKCGFSMIKTKEDWTILDNMMVMIYIFFFTKPLEIGCDFCRNFIFCGSQLRVVWECSGGSDRVQTDSERKTIIQMRKMMKTMTIRRMMTSNSKTWYVPSLISWEITTTVANASKWQRQVLICEERASSGET